VWLYAYFHDFPCFYAAYEKCFCSGFFSYVFFSIFFFWFFHSELGNSELHWQTTTTTMRMTLPCYLHWELATGLMWQADSAKNCETLCPRISPLMSFEERRRRSCFWPTTVAFDVLIMREINSFHNVSLVCINWSGQAVRPTRTMGQDNWTAWPTGHGHSHTWLIYY